MGDKADRALLDTSKGDMVIDFRQGEAHMLKDVKKIAGGVV